MTTSGGGSSMNVSGVVGGGSGIHSGIGSHGSHGSSGNIGMKGRMSVGTHPTESWCDSSSFLSWYGGRILALLSKRFARVDLFWFEMQNSMNMTSKNSSWKQKQHFLRLFLPVDQTEWKRIWILSLNIKKCILVVLDSTNALSFLDITESLLNVSSSTASSSSIGASIGTSVGTSAGAASISMNSLPDMIWDVTKTSEHNCGTVQLNPFGKASTHPFLSNIKKKSTKNMTRLHDKSTIQDSIQESDNNEQDDADNDEKNLMISSLFFNSCGIQDVVTNSINEENHLKSSEDSGSWIEMFCFFGPSKKSKTGNEPVLPPPLRRVLHFSAPNSPHSVGILQLREALVWAPPRAVITSFSVWRRLQAVSMAAMNPKGAISTGAVLSVGQKAAAALVAASVVNIDTSDDSWQPVLHLFSDGHLFRHYAYGEKSQSGRLLGSTTMSSIYSHSVIPASTVRHLHGLTRFLPFVTIATHLSADDPFQHHSMKNMDTKILFTFVVRSDSASIVIYRLCFEPLPLITNIAALSSGGTSLSSPNNSSPFMEDDSSSISDLATERRVIGGNSLGVLATTEEFLHIDLRSLYPLDTLTSFGRDMMVSGTSEEQTWEKLHVLDSCLTPKWFILVHQFCSDVDSNQKVRNETTNPVRVALFDIQTLRLCRICIFPRAERFLRLHSADRNAASLSSMSSDNIFNVDHSNDQDVVLVFADRVYFISELARTQFRDTTKEDNEIVHFPLRRGESIFADVDNESVDESVAESTVNGSSFTGALDESGLFSASLVHYKSILGQIRSSLAPLVLQPSSEKEALETCTETLNLATTLSYALLRLRLQTIRFFLQYLVSERDIPSLAALHQWSCLVLPAKSHIDGDRNDGNRGVEIPKSLLRSVYLADKFLVNLAYTLTSLVSKNDTNIWSKLENSLSLLVAATNTSLDIIASAADYVTISGKQAFATHALSRAAGSLLTALLDETVTVPTKLPVSKQSQEKSPLDLILDCISRGEAIPMVLSNATQSAIVSVLDRLIPPIPTNARLHEVGTIVWLRLQLLARPSPPIIDTPLSGEDNEAETEEEAEDAIFVIALEHWKDFISRLSNRLASLPPASPLAGLCVALLLSAQYRDGEPYISAVVTWLMSSTAPLEQCDLRYTILWLLFDPNSISSSINLSKQLGLNPSTADDISFVVQKFGELLGGNALLELWSRIL